MQRTTTNMEAKVSRDAAAERFPERSGKALRFAANRSRRKNRLRGVSKKILRSCRRRAGHDGACRSHFG